MSQQLTYQSTIEGLQAYMQQYIQVPITILYGYIGTKDSQILIVQDGQIVSIGNFTYEMYRTGWLKDMTKFQNLAKQAELYRTRQREDAPSLHYYLNDDIYTNKN